MNRPLESVKTRRTAEQSPRRPRDREISILVAPDVALHQSRAGTARRQFMRRFVRVASLAGGDVVASAASATMVHALAVRVPSWIWQGGGAFPGAGEFCVAVVIALTLTGSYQKIAPAHATLRLLVGAAIGSVVVYWASLWRLQALGILPIASLLAVVTACALFLTRGALALATERLLPVERRSIPTVVLVADGAPEGGVQARTGYRMAARVSLDGHSPAVLAQELAGAIRRSRAEAVILLGTVNASQLETLLVISLRAGCEFLCTPPGYGLAGVRPSLQARTVHGFLQIGAPSLHASQFFAKRCVDVAGSCLALLLTLPLWLAIAIAIKLDSPGPIFFGQERVGLGGRRFRMLKFRTMREGADQEKQDLLHLNVTGDNRLFKIPNDPRISRVGQVLRRWSLDEMPQFLNVVGGQMSLVGPRPFFERDFQEYEEHHFRRLGAKPGITGLWQVYGRSSVLDFEEVVRMDTEYIDRWSLWLDLRILALTIPAVMRRTGAC